MVVDAVVKEKGWDDLVMQHVCVCIMLVTRTARGG